MSSNSHLVYSAIPPPSTETSAPLTAHMADGSSIRSRQSVPASAPAIPEVGTTAQDDRPSFRSGRRAWVRDFIRRHRPQRPVGDAPTAWRSIMAVVTSSCEINALGCDRINAHRTLPPKDINILLVFIPVSVRPPIHSDGKLGNLDTPIVGHALCRHVGHSHFRL